MLAQAVARLVPASVSAHGSVALTYDPADDTFARAADGARPDVLSALQACFDGVTGVTVVSSVNASASANARADAPRDTTKRLTAHDVQQQRTEQLSAKDPLLEAAVRGHARYAGLLGRLGKDVQDARATLGAGCRGARPRPAARRGCLCHPAPPPRDH